MIRRYCHFCQEWYSGRKPKFEYANRADLKAEAPHQCPKCGRQLSSNDGTVQTKQTILLDPVLKRESGKNKKLPL